MTDLTDPLTIGGVIAAGIAGVVSLWAAIRGVAAWLGTKFDWLAENVAKPVVEKHIEFVDTTSNNLNQLTESTKKQAEILEAVSQSTEKLSLAFSTEIESLKDVLKRHGESDAAINRTLEMIREWQVKYACSKKENASDSSIHGKA